MTIENWSLIKENSNNVYCQIGDDNQKFIKGYVEKNGKIISNILTSTIIRMNFNEAKCINRENYELGYMSRDYHNYLNAVNNQNGIIYDWYLYYQNNMLRIKSMINKCGNISIIDDEVISHNPISNQIILKNNGECFLITDSIDEYAKQYLITNNMYINFKNQKITNIQNYVIKPNIINIANQEVIDKGKTLVKTV